MVKETVNRCVETFGPYFGESSGSNGWQHVFIEAAAIEKEGRDSTLGQKVLQPLSKAVSLAVELSNVFKEIKFSGLKQHTIKEILSELKFILRFYNIVNKDEVHLSVLTSVGTAK